MKTRKFRSNFFELVAERFDLLEVIKKHGLIDNLPVVEVDFFINKDNYEITCNLSKEKFTEIDSALEKFEDDNYNDQSLINILRNIEDPEENLIKFKASIFYKYLSDLYYIIDDEDYRKEIDKFIHNIFNTKALYFDVEIKHFIKTGSFMVKTHQKRCQITMDSFDRVCFKDLLISGYLHNNIDQKKIPNLIKKLNNQKTRKNFRKKILKKFVDIDNTLFNPNFTYINSDVLYF